MKKENLQFHFLKEYAKFILDNHLNDFVTIDLKKAQDEEIPLLKYFQHLSPTELFELSKKGTKEYLEQLTNDTSISSIDLSHQKWKDDKMEGFTRDQVVASDISSIHNVRKHSLLEFLPLYTNNSQQIISIVKDMENFYAYQVELSIQTFAEINKEKIQKSETRLKDAQNLAQLGYWDYDIEGNKVKWSEELYHIYGLDPSTSITAEIIDTLIFPEDSKLLMDKVKNIYSQGGTYTQEYKIRRNNGETRYLIDKGYVEKAGANTIIKGISQDITEQKLAEINLVISEERLREAQALAHMGSWEWDTKTHKIIWSDELYRIFGYKPQELEIDFDTYTQHIHPEDLEMVNRYVKDCYEKYIPFSFEHKIINKEGKIRWIQARGKISQQLSDEVLKLSGTAMDITDRRLADDALKIRQQDLEASNKELEAFCYTVSHDLRSPLRAIDGFGIRLASEYENKLDTEGKRLLTVVRNNAQQMGVLIDSLLDFSRLNRRDINKLPIDMKTVIEKVIQECNEQYPEHHGEVVVGIILPALGDRTLIKMVWHNLLSNAIKFSAKKSYPRIMISSEQIGSEIVYSIQDNGAGFDMNYKNKLFGVFQRLHSQDEFKGTGVGLATIQRIVNRHGGRVSAEGTVNEGAKFIFTLPIIN